MSDVKKKSKCQKETFFFFQVFEKKMNDKRNLICGNVMLLSQSCGEISLSAFCKKKLRKLGVWVRNEKKNVRSTTCHVVQLDEKKLISILRIAG